MDQQDRQLDAGRCSIPEFRKQSHNNCPSHETRVTRLEEIEKASDDDSVEAQDEQDEKSKYRAIATGNDVGGGRRRR